MSGKRILIVEDNELNLKLMRDLLQAYGYETAEARNGIEGLELARRLRPDLILMDLQLPEMDGLEAIRRLKSDPQTRQIRVYAVTAFAMKGDEEKVQGAGCDGYIAKPIDTRQLIRRVQEVLASHSTPETP